MRVFTRHGDRDAMIDMRKFFAFAGLVLLHWKTCEARLSSNADPKDTPNRESVRVLSNEEASRQNANLRGLWFNMNGNNVDSKTASANLEHDNRSPKESEKQQKRDLQVDIDGDGDFDPPVKSGIIPGVGGIFFPLPPGVTPPTKSPIAPGIFVQGSLPLQDIVFVFNNGGGGGGGGGGDTTATTTTTTNSSTTATTAATGATTAATTAGTGTTQSGATTTAATATATVSGATTARTNGTTAATATGATTVRTNGTTTNGTGTTTTTATRTATKSGNVQEDNSTTATTLAGDTGTTSASTTTAAAGVTVTTVNGGATVTTVSGGATVTTVSGGATVTTVSGGATVTTVATNGTNATSAATSTVTGSGAISDTNATGTATTTANTSNSVQSYLAPNSCPSLISYVGPSHSWDGSAGANCLSTNDCDNSVDSVTCQLGLDFFNGDQGTFDGICVNDDQIRISLFSLTRFKLNVLLPNGVTVNSENPCYAATGAQMTIVSTSSTSNGLYVENFVVSNPQVGIYTFFASLYEKEKPDSVLDYTFTTGIGRQPGMLNAGYGVDANGRGKSFTLTYTSALN